MFDIAIVGVGATGISLLKEIQSQVYTLGLKPPRIALFSPKESFARGKAFGDAAQIHRVNTPPHMLSVSSCEPNGFSQWMQQVESKVCERYPTRLLYSMFLRETYQSMTFSPLLEIEEIQSVVQAIKRQSTGYRLQSQHKTIKARKVVLCLGSLHGTNFPDMKQCDGFIDHHSQLSEVNDDCVLIAGTGLTAVDMFRSIELTGEREIHLFSRNGLAPTCLTKDNRYVPKVVNWNTFLNLKAEKGVVRLPDLVEKFKQEFQLIPNEGERKKALQILRESGIAHYCDFLMGRANTSDCPFQDLLVSTRPYIHHIWNAMPIEDRIIFDVNYGAQWAAWRHPIPYEVFAEMALTAKEGRLYIHQTIGRPRLENGQFIVTNSIGKVIKSKNLVDGTGGNNRLHAINSPLLHSLVKENLIEAHPCGGVNVSPLTFQCQVNGKSVPDLFNLGPLSRGSLFSTNAFWFNARCASNWARQWAIEISRNKI